MQRIVVLDLLVRIEMEPALAALLLRPCVPRNRQRLHTVVGEFDQILLERIDAEGVFHLKGGKLSVRPVGLDKECIISPKKAGARAVIIEGRIVEIAEHRFLVCVLHGVLVLRCAPKLRLHHMTARAGLAADERRLPCVSTRCIPPIFGERVKSETAGENQRRDDEGTDYDRSFRQSSGGWLALTRAYS